MALKLAGLLEDSNYVNGKKNYLVLFEKDEKWFKQDIDSLDFDTLKQLAVQNPSILKYSEKYKIASWEQLKNVINQFQDIPKETRVKMIENLDRKNILTTIKAIHYFLHRVDKIDAPFEQILNEGVYAEKNNVEKIDKYIIEKINNSKIEENSKKIKNIKNKKLNNKFYK